MLLISSHFLKTFSSVSAKDEDIEYYEDPSGEDVTTNQPIVVTSESGRGSGLSVILNVEPDDYPNWSRVPYYGARILISDPNDYPETTVSYRFISLGESLDMKVQPLVFQCEDDIRNVSPEKRACWFHDEVLLQYTDRYSYETCLTECKIKTFLKYCGCVPYKYPISESTPICEFQNLGCLNNVTSYVSEEDRACDPVCYMECWDKRYSVTSDLTPFLPDMFPANVIGEHNVSELSALKVYYAKSTCNSYKLMLLMDFSYFIVTYGGLFSLCFGVSLLTIYELVYLLLSDNPQIDADVRMTRSGNSFRSRALTSLVVGNKSRGDGSRRT
ncbi:pickpocket protein 11-like [Papilio machaon]|uniref:pickpocket protein 11-like n=1 Tax=Papilio machaon TaxID=76193 RepID=UPI001E66431B|nr:pickpocket protein 11-like [Papilio machaon]